MVLATQESRSYHQKLTNRDIIAPQRNKSYQLRIGSYHLVSKREILEKLQDLMRLTNRGVRNRSHLGVNAALMYSKLYHGANYKQSGYSPAAVSIKLIYPAANPSLL